MLILNTKLILEYLNLTDGKYLETIQYINTYLSKVKIWVVFVNILFD